MERDVVGHCQGQRGGVGAAAAAPAGIKGSGGAAGSSLRGPVAWRDSSGVTGSGGLAGSGGVTDQVASRAPAARGFGGVTGSGGSIGSGGAGSGGTTGTGGAAGAGGSAAGAGGSAAGTTGTGGAAGKGGSSGGAGVGGSAAGTTGSGGAAGKGGAGGAAGSAMYSCPLGGALDCSGSGALKVPDGLVTDFSAAAVEQARSSATRTGSAVRLRLLGRHTVDGRRGRRHTAQNLKLTFTVGAAGLRGRRSDLPSCVNASAYTQGLVQRHAHRRQHDRLLPCRCSSRPRTSGRASDTNPSGGTCKPDAGTSCYPYPAAP